MAQKKQPEMHGSWPRAIGRAAAGALEFAGLHTFEQLTQFTEKEILNLHGVGPKAVGILRELLAEKGLSFKQS